MIAAYTWRTHQYHPRAAAGLAAAFFIAGVILLIRGYSTNGRTESPLDAAPATPIVLDFSATAGGHAEETLSDAEARKACRKGTRKPSHPGVGEGAPRVQFVHLPKAGGTSIQQMLSKWCADTPHCSYIQWDGAEFHGSSAKCGPFVTQRTLLAGHRGYGYCREVEIDKRGLVTFTVLREPISRIRSLYDYRLADLSILGKDTQDLSETIVRFNSTPEVEKGELRLRALGEQQTRFICGYHCMGPEGLKLNLNMSIEAASELVLTRAIRNLKLINVVGVLERFTEVIPQLQYNFDFVPLSFKGWPKENVVKAKKKSVLTEQAAAILREWSASDIRLYALASKIAKKKTEQAMKCMKLAKTRPAT